MAEKYNRNELRSMSLELLEMKHTRIGAYLEFVSTLCVITDKNLNYIENKIMEYANTQLR